MIVPEDADLHPSDPTEVSWTETIGFWFALPEESLYGNIYVLARPNVGASISSINVVQGHNHHAFSVDFTDPHMHAPCPDSMLDFTMVNGLQVKVFDPPTGYHFAYESRAGVCSMDLTYIGVMPAWDPNDPAENPLAATPDTADLGLGDAWAGGHLDFVGRVSGTLTLRGRTYDVDAMGGMDRSWGVRTELGQSAISYVHIPLGDDLGMHLVTGADLEAGRVAYGPLRFGYVYDCGEVFGVTGATMTGAQAQGLLPFSNVISLTDTRGRGYELRGTSIAYAPWYTFSPSYVTFQSLMRYELGGRVGHGLQADVYGIEFLADRTSRHGTRTRTAYGPGI